MGHRHANKLINSCSLCGLCREVCPEDLHMGLICKKARETMVDQGKMPPSAHDFPLRDMSFSNSDKCAFRSPSARDRGKPVSFLSRMPAHRIGPRTCKEGLYAAH